MDLGIIQGWNWGNELHPQSHLHFVDDTTLMGLAQIREASNLCKFLDVYLVTSGQLINEDKSSIIFFNTLGNIHRRIAHILRFHAGSLPLTYLGIPISIGNPPKDLWQGILKKILHEG